MNTWLLLTIELVCVALLVAGVALVYVPAAMVLAGVLGVVACERWSVAENERRQAERTS